MLKVSRKPTKEIEKQAISLWEKGKNPGIGWQEAEDYLKEKGYRKQEILTMNEKWAAGEYFYSEKD